MEKIKWGRHLIHTKDVLRILAMVILHIALLFGVNLILIDNIVPQLPMAINVIIWILMVPSTPLFMIPLFQDFVINSMDFIILALYSVLFNTALYLILRKVVRTIKSRRIRILPEANIKSGRKKIRRKDVLRILTIVISHIALMFVISMGAVHVDLGIAFNVIRFIILVPHLLFFINPIIYNIQTQYYDPLFDPTMDNLFGVVFYLVVVLLNTVLLDTALYFILRKVFRVIKSRRNKVLPAAKNKWERHLIHRKDVLIILVSSLVIFLIDIFLVAIYTTVNGSLAAPVEIIIIIFIAMFGYIYDFLPEAANMLLPLYIYSLLYSAILYAVIRSIIFIFKRKKSMNKRVARFMIILFSLLLLVGVGIFLFNRERVKPLRLAAIFQGRNIGDVSADGFMLLSFIVERQVTDVRYYQWDGKSTWGFTIPGENEYRYNKNEYLNNTKYAWSVNDYDWSSTWKSTDYPRYHFSNNALEMDYYNRVNDTWYNSYNSFVRFSPDGKSVGAISYLRNKLYVSLWENGQCRWQTNLPVSASAKIDGSNIIDLLVTNQHEILLYIKFIKERKERPIIMLNQNGKEIEANLWHEYQNAIEAYVKAIPVPKQRNTQAWSIPTNESENFYHTTTIASSPYRQFRFVARENFFNTVSLVVYAYPHSPKASIRGKITNEHDYRYVKLDIPDHADFEYEFDCSSGRSKETQFSPDGHHLLLQGRGGWGLFEW